MRALAGGDGAGGGVVRRMSALQAVGSPLDTAPRPMGAALDRAAFLERMAERCADASPSALVLLDVDGFRLINHGLGHRLGDELLLHVRHRLQSALQPSDTLGCMGGDEFAVFIRGLDSPEAVLHEVSRLLKALAPGVVLGAKHEVFVSVSAGIALFPQQTDDPAELLRFADIALNRAKLTGRGRAVIHDVSTIVASDGRHRLHARLRRVLEQPHDRNDYGLRLHYQPVVDTRSGKWLGYEALLRWHDPGQQAVSAQELIEVAEITGLIVPLGQWVLEEACRQLRAWMDAGIALPVAINVAVEQLHCPDFPDQVVQAMQRHRVPAELLGLEITESQVMTDPQRVQQQLARLSAVGVSLSLDDFGTGYASLAHLRQLPVQRLKISRDFISDIPHDRVLVAMASFIVELAQALGLDVVAEGVETEAQRAFLQRLAVPYCQGWLFAPALPATEVSGRMSCTD